MASQKINSVLFICLGNICRSPTAEAIFRNEVKKRGLSEQWLIDSAGTVSWNVGRRPDSSAQLCLEKHGLSTDHRARQISTEDFQKFDVIVGMDNENMSDLQRMKPANCKAKLKMLGDFDPVKPCIINDPMEEVKRF